MGRRGSERASESSHRGQSGLLVRTNGEGMVDGTGTGSCGQGGGGDRRGWRPRAALGRAFAQAGASIALLDIDESAAKAKAVALAGEFDVPTTALMVDVGDEASIDARPATSNGRWAVRRTVRQRRGAAVRRHRLPDRRRLGLGPQRQRVGHGADRQDLSPLIRQRAGWRRIVSHLVGQRPGSRGPHGCIPDEQICGDGLRRDAARDWPARVSA